MTVKYFPSFFKVIRDKGRFSFSIVYDSKGIKLNWKPFRSQLLRFEEFHTNKKKRFIEKDGICESEKKLQLTNRMINNSEKASITNDEEADEESDEEFDKEFSLEKLQVKDKTQKTNKIVEDRKGFLQEENEWIEEKVHIRDELEKGEIKKYLNNWIYQKGKERTLTNSSNKTLNEELAKLEIALRPSPNDVNNTKQFLYFLQNEINKKYTNCHVTPFGSVINGFWTKNSDIDICIQVPVLLNKKDQIKFLKKICVILNTYKGGIIEQRFSAKVPIIHFSLTKEKNCLELSCDISINNILAIVNSKLIQQYVNVDKRLQIMGIALKYWSKNRNINDRSKGFLSSFSLILMIIHFLQNVADPKILPSLQDISFERNEKPYYVLGVDCKYCKDQKIIKEKLYKINNYRDANTDIGTLVIQFFKFYGYQYKNGVIAIRDITNYYQNFHALKDFESYFLFVDNPFEVGKNVANVMPQNYKTIINEMKRAYQILKANGTWKDVCHSSDDSLRHYY